MRPVLAAILVVVAATGCSTSAPQPVLTEARPKTLPAVAISNAAKGVTTLHKVDLLGRDLVLPGKDGFNFDPSGVSVHMRRQEESEWKRAEVIVWRPEQLTVQFGSDPWTKSPGTLLFRVRHSQLLQADQHSNELTVPVTAPAAR